VFVPVPDFLWGVIEEDMHENRGGRTNLRLVDIEMCAFHGV